LTLNGKSWALNRRRTVNDQDIERQLKNLVPRPLSPEVKARIAERLRSVEPAPARLWFRMSSVWLRAAAVLALAVGTLALWMHGRRMSESHPATVVASTASTASPVTAVYEPVTAKTVLVKRQDEGIVTGPDFAPARQITCDLVDHMEWRSQSGRERYILNRPRKEVVFVSCETY
jgi:hypothetical protein